MICDPLWWFTIRTNFIQTSSDTEIPTPVQTPRCFSIRIQISRPRPLWWFTIRTNFIQTSSVTEIPTPVQIPKCFSIRIQISSPFSDSLSEQILSILVHWNAPWVDSSAVPVVEGVKLLSDGGDLFDAILMGGKVALEGLVFLLHGLQLEDLAILVVLKF